MSKTYRQSSPSLVTLYDRIAGLVAYGAEPTRFPSGFTDSHKKGDAGKWHPLGEMPERFFDPAAVSRKARLCVFDERAYVALRGDIFTGFERDKRIGTLQKLTIVLNGSEVLEVEYRFDGRPGWAVFPVALPKSIPGNDIRAVEIERDGILMLSQFASEDFRGRRAWRPRIWLIDANGKLYGSANAASDVPVEIHVDGRASWALTSNPPQPGVPRPFEFDLSLDCDDAFAKVAAFNPATGVEAVGSPIGVFRSQGEHFLFGYPVIRENRLRAVLLSWKDGKRRALSLGLAQYATISTIAEANLADAPEASFECGNNSFEVDLSNFRGCEILILDENSAVVGRLPPVERILAFAARAR